jgi:hypothetical protein
MTVNNNTQIANHKVQRDEVAAPIPVTAWESQPGKYILFHSRNCRMDSHTAAAIFRKMINEKIPQAQHLLKQLGLLDRHIKEFHYPLPLSTIFFIFVEELVEHYQNQVSERDENLDLEFIKLKRVLAKNATQIWPKDNHEIHTFMNLLKTKLSQVEAQLENFDPILNHWSELLNIQYLATMTLFGILLPSNYTQAHRLPSIIDKKGDVYVGMDLAHGQLLKAFSLILHQITNDLPWVIETMMEKIPSLENKELEKQFSLFTLSPLKKKLKDEGLKEFPTVASMVREYAIEMKSIIDQLSSMSFSDNAVLGLIQDRLYLVRGIVCDLSTDYEYNLLALKKDPILEFNANGVGINANHALFPHLFDYFDCVKLKFAYLDRPTAALCLVLEAIQDSNRIWDQYEKDGIAPSTTLTSIYSFDQEKAEKELLAEEGKKKHQNSSSTQKKKKVKTSYPLNQKKDSPRNGSKHAPTTTTNTTTTTTTTTSSVAPLLTHVERLRAKLAELFEQNPSSPLRQVIWHLDHLAVVQKTLAKSASSLPQHLCLLTSAAASSQKIMEQAYRYLLKEEQASFTTTHNLKEYHRQYDADFKAYPPIVKQLFLANHWVRYFYTNHRNWYFTTLHVEIPAVLDKLFKIADGQPYSPQELRVTVEEIVENSCKQVENLLKQDTSSLQSTASRAHEKIPVKAFPEQMFAGIQQKLENFQANFSTNHPLFLRVKQGIAALKMLEVSIRQMSKADDMQQLSTWTVWSLLQLQESIETIFHCIEHYKTGEMTVQHELKTLAATIGLEMGSLAEYTHELSYKVRYPAENKNNSLSAQIIDDLEALKEFPEIGQGFKLQNIPKILWADPSPDISLEGVIRKMQLLLIEAQKFLKETALPALQKAHEDSLEPKAIKDLK